MDAPLLRIVRGTPTDEELAALTAVLIAASGVAAAERASEAARSRPLERSRARAAPQLGRRPGGLARRALNSPRREPDRQNQGADHTGDDPEDCPARSE